MTKICNKCKIEKNICFFHKDKNQKYGFARRCKECAYVYYINNKEKILKQQLDYYNDNKEIILKYQREYNNNHKQKIKQYKQINKELIKKNKREWQKNKKNYDPVFKLISLRRHRRWAILKGKTKNHTIDDLGCSPQEWRNYIESKFDSNMTWKNYGSYWHLDEIIPCSVWDQSNKIEQKACFHYLNSRPLEAKENLSRPSKRNKDYTKEKQQFLMVLRALDILNG